MHQRGFSVVGVLILVSLIAGVLAFLFFQNFYTQEVASDNLKFSTSTFLTPSPSDANSENVEYFALTEGSVESSHRFYPIYSVYKKAENNPAVKIATLGTENEYVSQIVFSKSLNAFIVNFENKVSYYDINKSQLKEIYDVSKGWNINHISLSPSEDSVAVGTSLGIQSSEIVVINLKDFSTKKISKEKLHIDDEGYMQPTFWSDVASLYFYIGGFEGGGNAYKLDIQSEKVLKAEIAGLISPDGKKIADSKQLPPYGGCFPPDDFDLYWYYTQTGQKTIITSQKNTIFSLISWSPNSGEFLFAAQKYESVGTECPNGIMGKTDYFVYNLTDKKTVKVNSKSEQLAKWFPEMAEFFKEKKLDLEQYPLDGFIYLGGHIN